MISAKSAGEGWQNGRTRRSPKLCSITFGSWNAVTMVQVAESVPSLPRCTALRQVPIEGLLDLWLSAIPKSDAPVN